MKKPHRPEWAQAKVRLYFSRCWYGMDKDGVPLVKGINRFHDWLLLNVDINIHNWLIQPFFYDEGFPFRVIEYYGNGEKRMSEKLNTLPCPACGAYPDLGGSQDGSELWIACGNLRKCRMAGPSRKTVAEAVAAWNALPRALEWTDEPPKVPGWYWCRDAEREIRLCQLENFVGGPRLFICGISKHTFPDELTGIQWAGPIPEPQEPKGE